MTPGRENDVRALVVYELMFGNTRVVAEAVAAGIRTRIPVEMLEVGDAPRILPLDIELLVVGGPTHAHGMTKRELRADAGRRAGDRLVSRGIGIREWLSDLEPPARPIAAAVFDTRIKGPGLLWGSAAKSAAALLAGSFTLVRGPESFLVDGPTGPPFDRLLPREVERARAWAADLTATLPGPVGVA